MDMNFSKLLEIVKGREAPVGVFPFCFIKVRHKLNGHEFEQTPGDSEGQGRLVSCGPWVFRAGQNLATEQQQLGGVQGS